MRYFESSDYDQSTVQYCTYQGLHMKLVTIERDSKFCITVLWWQSNKPLTWFSLRNGCSV
jgi:hypothetical protein